jgi:hypothetical protein
MTPTRLLRSALHDPRHYQIAVVGGIVTYGALQGLLPVDVRHAAVVLASTLLTQALWCRLLPGVRFDARSPLISGISLCLLGRSSSLWLLALAGILAISSKFALRFGGKHLFNPTAFALVALMLATDSVWVSPGQWGSVAFYTLLFAGLGSLVVHRAARADVSWTFLGAYAAMVAGRAAWLGDPWSIPLHQMSNGALLLFAFHMISDPKTTPDSRAGRIVFAVLVAAGAWLVHFALYDTNGPLWSLVALAPVVPVLDRLLPGRRYRWTDAAGGTGPRPQPAFRRLTPPASPVSGVPVMTRSKLALPLTVVVLALLSASHVDAFCGFFVAKADTRLFNHASQVVLVRDGDRTVLSMANDYQGDAKEFAVVVPVPTFLEREQIHVADQALIDHLDAYSSPRLVEYFDDNPCRRLIEEEAPIPRAQAAPAASGALLDRARELGVTIEAKYTVGEYDILILSAEESAGLETWLRENGYKIPDGASAVLGSYLRQGMRFFVAKVNLEEQERLGLVNLRPLQVAYESRKFVLPIRLGMVNADGPQELFVYALTRTGRVETTNYPTIKLPTGMDLPAFVKEEFGDFYRDMFREQVERERMRGVFLEYAWDMNWCDPCAADPLSAEQLRELGVFWIEPSAVRGPARDVFVTRLHLRYDNEHFPEDLVFQETGDRANFQGRYVLRHPWRGDDRCPAAEEYRRNLPERFEREAQTLANLTGWEIEEIRDRMDLEGPAETPEDDRSWWQKLWRRGAAGR